VDPALNFAKGALPVPPKILNSAAVQFCDNNFPKGLLNFPES
jgi:hypothetical protein